MVEDKKLPLFLLTLSSLEQWLHKACATPICLFSLALAFAGFSSVSLGTNGALAFKALPTCCPVHFQPGAGWIIVRIVRTFRRSNRESLEASLGAVALTQLDGEQSFPESHQLVDGA